MPIAASVPISRMRSYTAISITFITLTSTIATSITRMKSVIRSIILAMLANGERPSHVWTSSAGLPSLFFTSPSFALECRAHLRQPRRVGEAHRDLHGLGRVHAQQLARIRDVDVAVAPSGSR